MVVILPVEILVWVQGVVRQRAYFIGTWYSYFTNSSIGTPNAVCRFQLFQRWGQPAQQQGRRFPSISSVRVLSIRWLLVFAFLADLIQHIHSLRASGVISFQTARDVGAEVRVFRKSAGTLCATPAVISFLVIGLFYQFFYRNAQRFGDFCDRLNAWLLYKIGLAILPTFVLQCRTSAGESGEGEIRTHGPIAQTDVFKTSALGHYATSPDK